MLFWVSTTEVMVYNHFVDVRHGKDLQILVHLVQPYAIVLTVDTQFSSVFYSLVLNVTNDGAFIAAFGLWNNLQRT